MAPKKLGYVIDDHKLSQKHEGKLQLSMKRIIARFLTT